MSATSRPKAAPNKELLLLKIRDLLRCGLDNGSFGGSTVFIESGVPLNTLGNDGDLYIDSATGTFYLKELGVWVSKGVFYDLSFKHIQTVPSNTWVITHGLNKYPSVTILDGLGNEIEACIQHIDENNTTISFFSASSPINLTGTVIFN